MSIYVCSSCSLPPLRWRDGKSYCANHAIEIGVLNTDEAYGIKAKTPQRVNTAGYTVTGKMSASEKLKAYMTNQEQKLRANGTWEEIGKSRVEYEEESSEFDFSYIDLEGNTKPLPF